MLRLVFYTATFLMLSMLACSSQNNGDLNTKIINEYLVLKGHLVNSKADEVQKSSIELLKLVKDDQSKTSIKNQLESISQSNDIKVQREHFEKLSIEIYSLAKSAKVGKKLYKQYCPMAFNNKGAFWISDSEEILNPYFGSMMLHCGSIKEEF